MAVAEQTTKKIRAHLMKAMENWPFPPGKKYQAKAKKFRKARDETIDCMIRLADLEHEILEGKLLRKKARKKKKS
jgi:hypothetical protein